MDNKYGLGAAKVASAHHEIAHETQPLQPAKCRHCGSAQLILCSTMNDHYCKDCGEYQSDLPTGYSTGRSADY